VADKIQGQESEAVPPHTPGNGSQSREAEQRSVAKPIKAKLSGQPSIRKGTGPRTAQGKKRSSLNALKRGLFSKVILLDGESRAEYSSLLNGLRDDWQPQGTMEAVHVESLAVLFWRRRRFFQAEIAEISESMEFTENDSATKRYVEAWDWSRTSIAFGGLLKHSHNPIVVRQAKEMLTMSREALDACGFSEDSWFLKKLYGEDQDGGTPIGLRLLYETYATIARKNQERGDKTRDAELKQMMLVFMDAEIKRLTKLENILETDDKKRIQYKLSAAIIPGHEASERLLRYETHLSREIDRILNQLERLQRMRKGQPVPPTLNVKVST
jgi:hypothetical protein